MRLGRRVSIAFRFPWRSSADIRRDIDDELEFHLAMRAKDLERNGLSPRAAQSEALKQFGDLEQTRHSLSAAAEQGERARRFIAALESIWRETARAFRSLWRKPGLAICAVAVLAVSVGATVVVFSLIDGLVLRELPIRDPSRVVVVGERPPPDAQWTMQTVRLAALEAWEESATSLDGVAGYVDARFTWRGPEGPEQIAGGAVVGDLFPLLGAAMTVGRPFTDADSAALPVVLSHDFWQQRFGARSDVIGMTFDLDGVTYTVVGVLPADTGLPMLLANRAVWIPLTASQRVPEARLHVVARLRGRAEPAVVAQELGRLQSAVEDDQGVARKAAGVVVESMGERRTALVGPTLATLFGGALLLLLIACTNVGSLSVLQMLERRRELAVRASLGATSWHLVWHVAARQLVFWSIGGALGIALGALGLLAVRAVQPFNANEIPSLDIVGFDGRLVLFACSTTLVTGLLFGVLPALRASKIQPAATVREGGGGSTSHRSNRGRLGIVVAQVALSTALATTAVLLAKSSVNLASQQLGFDSRDLVTWQLQLPARDYPSQARRLQFQRALLASVRALPGIEDAATTSALPLGTIGVGPVPVEGRDSSNEPTWAGIQAVDRAYFRTVRSRVIEGRAFAETDVADGEPVIVVNETFAKRYLAGRSAVGARASLSPGAPPSLRIVGVVEDVKHAGLSWDYLPEIFVPYEQIAEGPTASFLGATLAVVMRVPHALAPTERLLRERVAALDHALPLIDIATGSQLVQRSAKGARFRAWVIADVAVLALVLSALGLYGVLARNVEQRSREFGVRMALGATAGTLFGRVCGTGVALAGVGVAIGLAAVCAGARSLQALLFGVTALEPLALGGAALLMLVVAAIASIGPAWRTMRLNPTVAIRDE